jgi:hypothetical protein
MKSGEKLILVIMGVILIVVMAYFYNGQTECAELGGEYVRGLFGFKCIK